MENGHPFVRLLHFLVYEHGGETYVAILYLFYAIVAWLVLRRTVRVCRQSPLLRASGRRLCAVFQSARHRVRRRPAPAVTIAPQRRTPVAGDDDEQSFSM
jgi:hypothetical protein